MAVVLLISLSAAAADKSRLPAIKVSDNKRFLVTADGKPFFYLGDTAWEIFHRLDRQQVIHYLDVRKRQGFNVIQAVALAEFDGLTDPNVYGALPLTESDPAKPAVTPGSRPGKGSEYDYWDHVDYVVDQANQRGIYVGLLPSWGRWAVKDKSGPDPILTSANAAAYGEFLGKRYRDKGIIWILGGDRNPTGYEQTWRALAKGIAAGASGKEDYAGLLMTFHPRGAQTSSTNFHTDDWLDFNMQQTGHGITESVRPWDGIAKDYNLQPVKPVIDGEPLYEDHPLSFQAAKYGYSFDAHIRQRAYWDVFSGTCGHTYGNHAVWQMLSPRRPPVNGPLFPWEQAIERPGANQIHWVRDLIESRPYFSRVPDQSLIVDPLDNADYIAATRGDGYAFIYSAQGRKFSVTMGKISGAKVKAYWFSPRAGTVDTIDTFDNNGTREFTPPSRGFGADWVLVLDDASKNFRLPERAQAK